MKYRVIGLIMLFAVGVFGLGGACDKLTEACGPCGVVANGDATISGNAELDGIFKAVGTLKLATGSIDADFKANVMAIGEAFGLTDLTADMDIAAMVTEVKGAISAELNASVQGDLKIKYAAPKCSANVDVSVQASAQCEAKLDANCSADVECTGPEASFECSGKCEGSCEGTCSVPTCEVAVSGPTLTCEGECKGACAVDVTAECSGKCEGDCSGDCSAYVDDGAGGYDCAGSCDATCTGKCEVQGQASCEGECRGSCKLTGPEAEASCEGELKCEGECQGSCSGGCEGEIKAPSCEGSAECSADASAKCEAQASAQASASLECTPPTLEIGFDFDADMDAQAQAAFIAKMDVFKAKMTAIVQGMFKLRALVDVNYAEEIGITPPTVAIGASVDAFIDALGAGEIEFTAVGLAPCAIGAFEETATILVDMPGEMMVTVNAQLDLVSVLDI